MSEISLSQLRCPSNLTKLGELLSQPNYPCVAAVHAFKTGEVRTGEYADFGDGSSGPHLRTDLAGFIREFLRTRSPYLTYCAVYDGPQEFTEAQFENRLWNELSHLTSFELKEVDWGAQPSDPKKKDFTFSLFGEALFVVGLHPNASRKARRFFKPMLVFNLMKQFELLKAKGAYFPMVDAIRKRDRAFAGAANPMAEAHGETWEAIQFSGKENKTDWKCPFRFALNAFL
jgi:FPC/CPF motif-containing protein YcgG